MLGNFIKKQFIDVIEWPNPEEGLLMWRFPVADQEIQNGASLTVREAQAALFVDEGKAADVFRPLHAHPPNPAHPHQLEKLG